AGAANAFLDARHRQMPADHARRTDEHLLRPATDRLRSEGAHASRVVETSLAGAGVGVARADDDPASVAAGQQRARNLYRGRDDPVLREDPRGRREEVAHDQRQIETARVGPQTRVNASITIAAGEGPVGHRVIPPRTHAPRGYARRDALRPG